VGAYMPRVHTTWWLSRGVGYVGFRNLRYALLHEGFRRSYAHRFVLQVRTDGSFGAAEGVERNLGRKRCLTRQSQKGRLSTLSLVAGSGDSAGNPCVDRFPPPHSAVGVGWADLTSWRPERAGGLGEHGWPYRTQPRPVDVLTVVDFDNPHTALRTGARVHHGVVKLMIPQIYRDISIDPRRCLFLQVIFCQFFLQGRNTHCFLEYAYTYPIPNPDFL
jgi:hypothetical protein